MSLLVFTMNYSRPPVDWSLLIRSGKRVGIEIASYGEGLGWPNSYGQAKIVDALGFLTERSEDIVLYTDSQDSFIARPAVDILAGYERAVSPQILLQAEKNCYPEREWGYDYPEVATPWRFICAGGWMGRRESLLQALDEIHCGELFKINSHCDQRLWTDWYLRFPGAQARAKLDTNCEVFQSMAGTGEMEDDGRNGVTKTYPSVIHFNGRVPGREEWYGKVTGDVLA